MSYRAISFCLALTLSAAAIPVLAQQAPARPAGAAPAAPRPAAPAAAAPAPVRAAPPPMAKSAFLLKVDSEFLAMDANKDGRLTKQEIETFRAAAIAARRSEVSRARFAQLDTDHNGSLSPQEFERTAAPVPAINAQPLVTKMDTNRDQQVTQAEYRAGAVADFDRLDINKDGFLSQAEARANNPAPK